MTSLRSTVRLLPLVVTVILSAEAPQGGRKGMVFVPGGEFLRGRSHALPDDGLKWWPELLQDDRPVRKIFVDPFYMDEREVTIAEYAAFVGASRRKPPYNWAKGEAPKDKANHPVAGVSWFDADAYCRSMGKRLPTEAEWERAARGIAEGATYPWGDRDPTKKDARFDTVEGPGPVGQFKPNHFGLYDMAGSVWEWCADWYERNYYAAAPEKNPKGPEKGQYKVIRGGSWSDVSKFLTVAHRSWARPGEESPNIGFRCVTPFGKRL